MRRQRYEYDFGMMGEGGRSGGREGREGGRNDEQPGTSTTKRPNYPVSIHLLEKRGKKPGRKEEKEKEVGREGGRTSFLSTKAS